MTPSLLSPECSQMEQGTIMIVDDTPENLRVLEAILKQRGYEVRPAPDGSHRPGYPRDDPLPARAQRVTGQLTLSALRENRATRTIVGTAAGRTAGSARHTGRIRVSVRACGAVCVVHGHTFSTHEEEGCDGGADPGDPPCRRSGRRDGGRDR